MQLAGLLRNDRRAGLLAVFTLAAGLVGASLGCGGAGNDETVILPPGGIAIGELVCTITSSIPGDVVLQGEVITITFRITDVNQRLIGQFLPVSFEVLGGYVPDPPDITDENGEVTVFLVTDPDYVGNAYVRLIQPENDLRCDITFRMVQPACSLTVEIQDEMATPVASGCGSSVSITRDTDRTLVWTVTRPDSVSGVPGPVAGAYLWIRTSGQVPDEFQIGPTDAMGQVSLTVGEGEDLEPHPEQVGELTVSADVIIPDSNSDGLEDALPCNGCAGTLEISDPPCDQDGAMVMVSYPYLSVLRPTEMATLDLTLTRDGVPIADEDLFVTAQNGSLNGSALPITITTDAMGEASVVYEPFAGFGGTIADPETDTITFEAGSPIECVLTGTVNVATCGLEAAFTPDAEQGVVSSVVVTVTNVDTSTTDGEPVSLNATGGTLSPPIDVTGPLMVDERTINFSGGNTATTGSLSLSFLGDYPCETVTTEFPILP